MLLRLAQYGDARQLTDTVIHSLEAWSSAALLAEGGVAHDAAGTAQLLAAWMQITTAATGDCSGLLAAFDADPGGPRAVQELAGSAVAAGPQELQTACTRWASALTEFERASLLASWAPVVAGYLRQAGGLDELLEEDGNHARLAEQADASWVSSAAWTICVMTDAQAGEAVLERIRRLVETEGCGAELWQLWARVAASMMSPRYLSHFKVPAGANDLPVSGLPHDAVEAVHGGVPKQMRRVQRTFDERTLDQQTSLLLEMAAMIGTTRSLPSRRADRVAERTSTVVLSSEQEEVRATVAGLMEHLPPQMVERTGRMYALALRAVLAFIDGERPALAAVLARIQSWDDDPGRLPYSLPRFQFPCEQVMAKANAYFYRAELHGAFITDKEASEGAADLVARYAPAEHRGAAQKVLRSMKGDRAGGAEFAPATVHGPAGLLAFAATAGWLACHPRVYRSREAARLALISEIKESEARALLIPDREMITEIRDEEALAFLDQLYAPEQSPLAKGAFERAVWEIDVLAVLKQHLLEAPADVTSAAQASALRERLSVIVGGATPSTGAPRPDRSNVVRQQPRRTSKRKRK
ncbi:hypothetical protein [Streptacidiphilus sp. EB103A]|uniref:hypothetical protein n=1 Tax=Streptacidiphilus sp. EB103A TaxID=3156275 RepID=UPI003515F8BB